MAEKTIKTRIIHKHDIEEHWNGAIDFVPKQGEIIIYDIDSTYDYERFKIGDGKTVVNLLPFATNLGVGRETDEGGEVFNDYETNHALSSKSHTEGTYNTAGSMSFSITAYDVATKTFTLDSVEGLTAFKAGENGGKDTPGDTYSCQMSYNYDVYGQIISINEDTKTVVVDIAPEEVIDNNGKNVTQASITDGKAYFYIPGKPNLGTKPWGTGAHAEGYGTYAVSVGAHSEGYNNISAGKYSHTEGNSNIAAYAAHAEGLDNKSIGQQSHTEGHGNTATAINSHAEGLNTYANGDNSHTEGSGTITHKEAYNSHAEGSGSQVKANAGHAEGDGCIVHENAEAGHAEGKLTNAHGEASHAEGRRTITYCDLSHAEGDSCTAHESAFASHAEGGYTHTHAEYSHAEGHNTNAYGEASHVEGKDTIAYHTSSHAEGFKSVANQPYSHAEGSGTYANGVASHTEGSGTTATGVASHAEGYSSDKTNYVALGDYSHTEGYNTKTGEDAQAAHAEGEETVATGRCSHSEGFSTESTGEASHAEGYDTVANLKGSHAEGVDSKANAEASHAEGEGTYTGGIGSHAEGQNTQVSGSYCHGEGIGIKIMGNATARHVQGKYNTIEWSDNYAHVVGNGTDDDNRSNAHTLGWNGDAWYAGKVTAGASTNNSDGAMVLTNKGYVDSLISDVRTSISNIQVSSDNRFVVEAEETIADDTGAVNLTVKTAYDNIFNAYLSEMDITMDLIIPAGSPNAVYHVLLPCVGTGDNGFVFSAVYDFDKIYRIVVKYDDTIICEVKSLASEVKKYVDEAILGGEW